jgi:vitamin K-dependent gamma-carboxylase
VHLNHVSEQETSIQHESWGKRFVRRLFEPTDAASVGAFRVMFGLLMLWEVFRFFQHDWIRRYYIDPQVHFTYLFFEWVRPLPGPWMYALFTVMGVLAALIAVGVFYRTAMVLFTLGFTYVFLLEQARYLNHFYLIVLVSFLMCFVSADHWMALDRRFYGKRRPEWLPFWQLFLLRAQMFLVYFFGGIAKINPDWLRAEPVRQWMQDRAHFPVAGPVLAQEWTPWFIAYGGLIFDLGIGFLLLYRRTRLLGMILAFGFHATNNYLFKIGVFPYLAMGMTLLFLEPDWPRRFLADMGLKLPPRERETPAPAKPQAAVVAALGAYLLIQVILPLRHWVYPGDVNWTEEGHRFSWRMKLRSKMDRMTMQVRDPETKRAWVVDPLQHLRDWQLGAMTGRPDMVLQLAHLVRDRYAERYGIRRPEVYVRLLCALNDGAEAELIDSTVDLGSQRRGLFPAHWILRERRPASVTAQRNGAPPTTDSD